MDIVVGISLALLVGLFAAVTGFDRDRAFYPAVTLVVASYYELFGVMGGSMTALGMETIMFVVFAAISVIGFKANLWLIVGALAGHGLFDSIHSFLISNPGIPAYWPNFCMSYDVTAALYLAWRLTYSVPAQAPVTVTPQSAGGMS